MIPVTKTYLPPLTEYQKYLENIWISSHVTNYGPLVKELQQKLKEYLGVKHLFFVTNGTVAIQVAIKALELKGEIITTPFSYVATVSSIVWEGCDPVFADIDPNHFTLDASLIEKSITKKTSAILATHVYGIPCDVEAIEKIAHKHNLRIVYDAAHAFDVLYKEKSLLSFGDISTISFHATKLFHTGEGGAIVTNDDELAHKISYLINFGHKGQEDFWGLGINGKTSELHAAMGLCVLPKVKELILRRKFLCELYDKELSSLLLTKPRVRDNTVHNYSYYPVLFSSEEQLLKARKALNEKQIFPRRYFYPSLNTLNYVREVRMPVAEDISKRVLCLPLYYELSEQDLKMICEIIINAAN